MITKKLVFVIVVLFNAVSLCGCWNYTDIEKYSLVTGLAIDWNGLNNKYKVTAEILDFEIAGKDARNISQIIESEGNTIFDAVGNVTKVTGRKLYWGHSEIIIISKSIAQQGIIPVIDLVFRDAEMREEMSVIIPNTEKAADLLRQEPMTRDLHAFEIDKILKGQKKFSIASQVQVYQIAETLKEEGISPVLPAVHLVTISGKRTAELMGSAVFKKDKLVGFLNAEESKYALFAANKVKKGVLIEKVFTDKSIENISLEIFKNTTKIKPVYSDGQLVMNLDIRTDVAIGEIMGSTDYIEKDAREKLRKDAEKFLKSSIENLIAKVQSEYDADIFGFGKIIKAEMPKLWKSIGPKWDEEYKNLKFNVNVEIDIRNSALNSKTL